MLLLHLRKENNVGPQDPRGTKPTDLKGPIPDTGGLSAEDAAALDEFSLSAEDAAALNEFSVGEAGDVPLDSPDQEVPAEVGYQGPGAGVIEGVANALPAVGGLVGGIAGGIGPQSIPLGMFGAAAGTAWKQLILQNVMGRVAEGKQDDPSGLFDTRNINEMKREAETAGLGALLGFGVSKGAATAIASKRGQAALDWVADKAAEPLAALKATVERARSEIFEGVDRIFADRVTAMTGEEAGNKIKSQFVSDIQNRYAGFIKSYGELDQVAQDIPLRGYGNLVERGESLVGKATVKNPTTALTDRARDWATDMPQGTYKNVKAYADRFDQVTNGRDYLRVLADLQSEADDAAKAASKYSQANSIRDRAAALQRFADEAEAHYEDKIVGGLAKRIAEGKATPAEIDGFQRMMASQTNPSAPVDPKYLSKYTRAVAKDYLDQKDIVRKSYAQFRGLLEDIGDVAKVNPAKLGPRQFARALSEVPPDKLAERAFDPKNAEAMRIMANEYPQVYDTIVRNKMSSIIAKHTSVAGDIDYDGIATVLKDMPEAASRLLMNSKEYGTLLRAVNDPRLKLLTQEQAGIANRFALGLARMGEIMRTSGKQMAQRPPTPMMPKVSQVAGQGLARAFMPGISLPEDQQ